VSISKNILQVTAILLALITAGCTQSNAKLVGGEGQVYIGGMTNQKVRGDAETVSVWNIWTAEDGLPLARQHCQRFGGVGAEIIDKRGITGYYKCIAMSAETKSEILQSELVKEKGSQMTQCIRTNVVYLDDFVSDAKTIATAVATQCKNRMVEFVDAYISQMPSASELSATFVSVLKEKFAEGEAERVLPYVLGWRNLVKNGWDKKTPPTPEQAPDQLFYQTI
jgi:hypothetical protein